MLDTQHYILLLGILNFIEIRTIRSLDSQLNLAPDCNQCFMAYQCQAMENQFIKIKAVNCFLKSQVMGILHFIQLMAIQTPGNQHKDFILQQLVHRLSTGITFHRRVLHLNQEKESLLFQVKENHQQQLLPLLRQMPQPQLQASSDLEY